MIIEGGGFKVELPAVLFTPESEPEGGNMADDKTQKTLAPRQATSRSLVEIRPRTTHECVEIAPPRCKQQASRQDTASQRRPVHEEPRQLQPPKLVPMGTLGDELRAKLDEARNRGDKRELARAIDAGVALGLDDELVSQERKNRTKKISAKFAGAIKAAREAFAEACKLSSEISVERALHRLREAVGKATRFDPKRRSKGEILDALGTSEAELDFLPDLFFTTVTIVPADSGKLFYEKRGDRCSCKAGCKPVTQTIEVNGRTVDVVYRCGRTVLTFEPTPQIAQGRPIDPPRPKIVPLVDGSYRLELHNATYLMRCERSVVEDDRLVGEDRWVYYVIDSDDTYDPRAVLIGSLKHGLRPEPSQCQIVLEQFVTEPLFAFLHEIGDEHFCYLAVQMKAGNVVVYEVPWSDELLETKDDPLIEIAHGFVLKAEEVSVELAVDIALAFSTEPTANA